jgi:hypothetical protein
MGYEKEELDRIYRRTNGKCHLCHGTIARRNYAAHGKRGAWEVDHSVPRARGGSDHGNNLQAACISCNRSKQDSHNRAIRHEHGHTRAPFSPKEIGDRRARNAVIGGTGLALLGGAVGGPVGFIAGALLGSLGGHSIDVD